MGISQFLPAYEDKLIMHKELLTFLSAVKKQDEKADIYGMSAASMALDSLTTYDGFNDLLWGPASFEFPSIEKFAKEYMVSPYCEDGFSYYSGIQSLYKLFQWKIPGTLGSLFIDEEIYRLWRKHIFLKPTYKEKKQNDEILAELVKVKRGSKPCTLEFLSEFSVGLFIARQEEIREVYESSDPNKTEKIRKVLKEFRPLRIDFLSKKKEIIKLLSASLANYLEAFKHGNVKWKTNILLWKKQRKIIIDILKQKQEKYGEKFYLSPDDFLASDKRRLEGVRPIETLYILEKEGIISSIKQKSKIDDFLEVHSNNDIVQLEITFSEKSRLYKSQNKKEHWINFLDFEICISPIIGIRFEGMDEPIWHEKSSRSKVSNDDRKILRAIEVISIFAKNKPHPDLSSSLNLQSLAKQLKVQKRTASRYLSFAREFLDQQSTGFNFSYASKDEEIKLQTKHSLPNRRKKVEQ